MARLLVIEDNPDNLELMTYLLQSFGHSVTTAVDGKEGLAAVTRDNPDLIVCDVHLPKMDGYEIASALKQDPKLRTIPIIAVTALAMVGDRDRGLAAGFDGYIDKPIEPEKFVEQVEKFLNLEQRSDSLPKPFGQTAPIADSIPTRRGRILVVDDSLINRELYHDILAPFGYEVQSTSNVQEAIQFARAKTPDLILSDLQMPGEDGFHFIRQVKADPQLANVPFILISASVWGGKERVQALQLGVNRFLLRPLEPQILLDEIAACIATYHGEGRYQGEGRSQGEDSADRSSR